MGGGGVNLIEMFMITGPIWSPFSLKVNPLNTNGFGTWYVALGMWPLSGLHK